MSDYAKLVEDLKRGFGHWYVEDWSRLVSMYADAAAAIEDLEARLGEAENSVERWKDMYLTKHEPKRGKKYPMRCPNCSTVVGVMEVQDGQ